VANVLQQAGVMDDLASAVFVSRLAPEESDFIPPMLEASCAILDLYAIEERAAVAEQRRDGLARPPAHEPHFVGFDESRVLTIATLPGAGNRVALHGAAVTPET
jgi:hypothetical protein